MTKFVTLSSAAALFALSSAAMAAPCSTGTTVKRDGNASTASTVDPGSMAKTTPGAKAESPGTVGAMNKAGSASGSATSAADAQRQSEGKPTAAQAAKGGDDC